MAANGFTTGSCAAAAAAAAVTALLEGRRVNTLDLTTPAGEVFHAAIVSWGREGESGVHCAVRKDGGDDPDVTTGLLIFAAAELVDIIQETQADVSFAGPRILIDGGRGIGRVTKPGLDQPVGEAAINSVPREMIEREVRQIAERNRFQGTIKIVISAPGGEELAGRTFNPRLGITGGISILGTTGVEKPMSTKAVIDTIRVQFSLHRAAGEQFVAVSPGNYGRDFIRRSFGFDLDRSVQCSNFIGDMLSMAGEFGFEGILLIGHIGKLVKLAGGFTNTHSMYGDCRMELMSAAALTAGADAPLAREILQCVSTEEAVRLLTEAGIREETMEVIMNRAMELLRRLSGGKFKTQCMMISTGYGLLSESPGAREMLETIRRGGKKGTEKRP